MIYPNVHKRGPAGGPHPTRGRLRHHVHDRRGARLSGRRSQHDTDPDAASGAPRASNLGKFISGGSSRLLVIGGARVVLCGSVQV